MKNLFEKFGGIIGVSLIIVSFILYFIQLPRTVLIIQTITIITLIPYVTMNPLGEKLNFNDFIAVAWLCKFRNICNLFYVINQLWFDF